MLLIGENIHIIAPKVKEALNARDGAFFVNLARKQKRRLARTRSTSISVRKRKPAPK